MPSAGNRTESGHLETKKKTFVYYSNTWSFLTIAAINNWLL